MPAAKPSFPARPHGPLAAGLVLGLPMYEGSGLTVNDLSGTAINGTLNGGATWTAGAHGYCLSFDGTSGYVGFTPAAGAMPNIEAAKSIEAWLTYDGTNTRRILFSMVGSPDANSVDLEVTNDGFGGIIIAAVKSGGGLICWAYLDATGANVGANNWFHVVYTNTASYATQKMYLNGTDWTAGTNTSTQTGTTATMRIGSFDASFPSPFWNKLVGTVKVYSRVLSAADVTSLYADSFKIYRRSRTMLKPAVAAPSIFLPSPFYPPVPNRPGSLLRGAMPVAPQLAATVFTISASGGIVIGSDGSVAPIWIPAPSGGVIDGSNSTSSPIWTPAQSGGSVDGSGATTAPAWSQSPAGGVVDGSSGTGSPVWAPTPSGGAVDGSGATATPAWTQAPSGGMVDGSSGTAAPTWTQSPSGGAVDGSDATTAPTWNMAPSGGTVSGSGSTSLPTWTPTTSGGAVDGSGASVQQSGVFTASGTGGSVAGSTASALPAWTPAPAGGSVTGAVVYPSLGIGGSGGAVVGSASAMTWAATLQASGGSVDGSAATVVYTPLVTANLYPTIYNTVSYLYTLYTAVAFETTIYNTVAFETTIYSRVRF